MKTHLHLSEHKQVPERKQTWLWTLASLLIMAAIFWFSSRNGEQSSLQSNVLAQILAHFMPADTASFIVRKTAHFTIYLALGFCVLHAMKAHRLPGKWVFAAAWCWCIVYAASDEWHQMFIDGRSGQLRDVCLDSAGALAGCLMAVLRLHYKHDKIH